VRARPLGVAAVLAAVATLLTSCRSNVGVAATVNGHQISESTVNRYVTQEGADPSLAAQAAAQNQQLPLPRTIILQTLVQERLYERALAVNGGVPTSGQLAAAHDKAVQQQFGLTSVGQALDRDAGKSLDSLGIAPSFGPTVVRYSELFFILVQDRLKVQTLPEFAAAIRKAGAQVRVNPRYGTWKAKTQTLNSSSSAGLPDYLRLQPTPAGSAAAGVPAP
jgi:hypothetical protein